jgi:hypothetical protein
MIGRGWPARYRIGGRKSMRPTSVQKVNAASAKADFKKERLAVSLAGGRAFFFKNIGPRNAPSGPIEVSEVSDYTCDQWIKELKISIVEESLNPRTDR